MVWVLEMDRRAWWTCWVLRRRVSNKALWLCVEEGKVGERVTVGRSWKVMEEGMVAEMAVMY